MEKCDPEIYEHGVVVAVMSGASYFIEALVVRTREDLGCRIDWHRAAGRAVIKFIGDEGDRKRVRNYILNRMRYDLPALVDGGAHL